MISLFNEAINHYDLVSQQFQTLRELFPFNPDEWDKTIEDERTLNIAVESLKLAQAAEIKGLAIFERIIDCIE